MEVQELIKVSKYDINNISFINREVLSSREQIELRREELSRGLALGNLYKGSTKLRFETINGKAMETEATIWAVTEKSVLLKNHISIPINSIFEVIV